MPASNPGIGHNKGPTMEAGFGWRNHCWTQARKDLLPNLPIEILRLRIKRAKQLGLPYKTYASVRASTGRDVIGFLFSSNALRVLREGQRMPKDRREKLAALAACQRIALTHPNIRIMDADGCLDAVFEAPGTQESWSQMRIRLKAMLRDLKLASNAVLIVGDTHLERDWSTAAAAAGYLCCEQYFGAQIADI